MRPTWVEINLNSVRKNFETVRNITGNDTSVMAVVKADAYGHGAVEVSRVLSDSGVEMFGVATVEEAMELRDNGISEPVIILGGIQPEEAESVIASDLVPAVYDISTLEIMERAAVKIGKRGHYHIKIDTGMSRLGFLGEQIEELIENVQRYKNIVPEGVFTHFASADDTDCSYTRHQIELFDKVVQKFKRTGINPKYIHMANSAAIQKYRETISNLVRPGIMIYGACSYNNTFLEPAMSVKSKIIQLKELPPGIPVSYGGSFRTSRKSRIAVIPVGYADGYLRNLSNRAYVSLKGRKVPVVGTVCMDFTIIDVTDVNNTTVGDEVVLFGNGEISIEQVACWGDTIPYEIMTIVGKRVRKVFI